MAAHEHSSTRRRVLGAAVALPILALTGLPALVKGQSPCGDSPSSVPPARGLSPNGDCPRPSSAAQALWNRRLAHYRRLHARWKAEAETGAFRAANERYNSERAALSARFGSWEKALRSRTGKPLCAAAFARIDAAEDAYYDHCTAPMQRAAVRLVLTPAPDVHALLVKLDVIREIGLEDFETMPRPAFELVREDLERFATARD